MESLRKKILVDERRMIDFDTIINLKCFLIFLLKNYFNNFLDISLLDDNFLYSIALLAENFGYYEQAKKFIACVKNTFICGYNQNFNRILM